MARKNRFFLGYLFGTALGGLFGLLFARKSGRRLRQEIKDQAKQGIMPIKTLGKEIVDVNKEAWGELKQWFESPEVQKVIAQGKLKVDEIYQEVKAYAEKNHSPQVQKVVRILEGYVKDFKSSATKGVKKAKKVIVKQAKQVGKEVVKQEKKLVKKINKAKKQVVDNFKKDHPQT